MLRWGVGKTLIIPTYLNSATPGYEAPVSGTLQVPFPATVNSSDFLVCEVQVQDAAAAAITVPAGWTDIGLITLSATNKARAFYLSAVGNEDGTNLDVTCTASVFAGGVIHRFRTAGGIEAIGTTSEAASDTSHPVVGVTTLGPNRLCVQLESTIRSGTPTLADITGETGVDYTQPSAVQLVAGFNFGIQTALCVAAQANSGGSAAWSVAQAGKFTFGFALY